MKPHIYLTNFKPGDKVQHKQCPSLKGVFVRYSTAHHWPKWRLYPVPPTGMVRRCYWKGWDPFYPDREEWTWEWAMEKQP